jgi:hypothetical protein
VRQTWGTTRRLASVSGAMLWLTVLTGCAPAPIAGGGYELVYHDEFDGDTLSGIWATAPFGGSLPPTVGDGVMTIRATAANDYQWAYVASTGPRIDTEPSYPFAQSWRFGYFEARLRFTDDAWAWPAFWLFSMAKTEAWPGEDCSLLNAEWDIMENGIGNRDGSGGRPASRSTFAVLHRNTTDNTEDGYCGIADEMRMFSTDFTDVDLSDWHTWAGRWTAGGLCTYLDDQLLGCVAPYDSTPQRMHIVFTMLYLNACVRCPAVRPNSLEMQVDWVRVWQ